MRPIKPPLQDEIDDILELKERLTPGREDERLRREYQREILAELTRPSWWRRWWRRFRWGR